MNDSIPAAGIAALLVLTIAVYVWVALGLAAVFAKAGTAPWRGWVPFVNAFTLLQLGGFNGWLILLGIIPFFGPLFVYVAIVVSCHRINVAFERGPGMTVLAALLLPVWASVLGFGSARWAGEGLAAPGPRRSSNAASDEFMSLFGAVPVEQRAPLVPPAEPRREDAAAPLSTPPLSMPSHTTPPPPYVPPAAPSVQTPPVQTPPVQTPPPQAPATPASPAPAAAGSAPHAADATADDAAHDDVSGDRRVTSPAPPAAQAAPVPSREQAPVSAADEPESEPESQLESPPRMWEPAPVPSHEPVSFETTGFLRAVADAEDDDFGDSDGGVISAVPPVRDEPAPSLYTRPAAWAPRAAPSAAAGSNAPADGAAADDVDGEADAFPEASGFVSAVVGAPDAGAPRSARSSVSALFAESAQDDDDQDIADETVIARRRRVRWVLHTPAGDVDLTSDVVILGRRPVPDPAHPTAQLVAIDDVTKTVSKTHARLTMRADTWYITDLGSTNGVLFATVMGTEVEAEPGVETEAGEHFLLGDAPLRLTRGDA